MISLIKSTFHNEEQTKKELVKFILKAPMLSFGKECQKFERGFARYQERKNCIFVNSGSSANLALIQTLLNMGKLKKGDKVGFSALTWSTNVMPVIQLGLIPIPIDVELSTLNVSSGTLKKTYKDEKIRLLFLTNLLGFCSDLEEIASFCKKNEIILIEDNCESLGSVYKGKKLGNFGLASTSSFYVGHHMSTVEGGAICTDSATLATQLRVVRAHGWDRNLSTGKQKKIRDKFKVNSTFYSRYTFYDLGYNLRPTEINGFIGNTQLKYIKEIVKIRQSNFKFFAKQIYSDERFYPIKFDHLDTISNFAVPVICKSRSIRDDLVKACDGKLEIRPIVGGDIAQQPFFEKYVHGSFHKNVNARLIHENGFYFGNNPELTKKEIRTIIDIVSK
jgi:CDP-6-deoxy-D-xylo-4-hexulose-3-dehydrase